MVGPAVESAFALLLTKVTKEELATMLLELLMFEKVQMICRHRRSFTDRGGEVD